MKSYKKIPDQLYDLLMQFDLSGSEFRVLLAIYKKTAGFHKKHDYISNSQIAEMCGGMSERTIIKATENLKLLQIITLVEKGNSSKKPNLWELNVEDIIERGLLHKKTLVQKNALLQKKVKTTAKKGKKLLQKIATTKDTITKDNIQKKESDFEIIENDKYTLEQFKEDFNLIRSYFLPNSRGVKVVDDKAQRQFKSLVKNGVTRVEMQQALKSLFMDKHHRESKWIYCTMEFITRGDKFARFSMTTDQQIHQQGAVGII